TYAWDSASNLTSQTDRLGRHRNYSYDADNQVTGEAWLNGAATDNLLTYTHDADGNVLTARDLHSAYTYTYDPLDRMTEQQGPWGATLSYTYDPNSNVVGLRDNLGGTTTSTYDALDQLTSRQFYDSGSATAVRLDQTWTARGQLAGVSRYSDL